MEIDLMITGGQVVDGTGCPAYGADVAVHEGKIKHIGVIERHPGVPALDASGLVVAPGFIDIHSHSDFTLVVDPRAISAVGQGVTLEVVGNCGHGCAPMADPTLVKANVYGYQESYPFAWNTFDEYLNYLQSRRPALNVAALVPNGNLRLACAGAVTRAASPEELKEIAKLLERSLEEGAFGYSTGLEYSLESGCSEEEIQELCRVARRRGRFYATHTRNRQGEPQEAIAEPIRAAEASGAPLQISHITCVARLSEHSRGAVEQALEQVDAACRRGVDVGFDAHTRTFGTTNLSAALPPWALEGEKSDIARRLSDPSTRKQLRRHPNIIAALAQGQWERIVVFESKAQPLVSRRSIAEIGRERGTDPQDTILDLLLAEIDNLHGLMIIAHTYRLEDIQIAFEHPECMVGSDAVTLALDGPLGGQSFHGAFSWAAWFLRYFVRDKKLLRLEDAVRRITSLPARRLGLTDRGIIRKGAWADLVVFDPQSFEEKATTFQPNQLATGVRHVLVNGAITMNNGERTDNRAGQVLRAS